MSEAKRKYMPMSEAKRKYMVYMVATETIDGSSFSGSLTRVDIGTSASSG